jgi:hypothetical protein
MRWIEVSRASLQLRLERDCSDMLQISVSNLCVHSTGQMTYSHGILKYYDLPRHL